MKGGSIIYQPPCTVAFPQFEVMFNYFIKMWFLYFIKIRGQLDRNFSWGRNQFFINIWFQDFITKSRNISYQKASNHTYYLDMYFKLPPNSIHFIFRKMFLKSKVEACKVLGLVLVIVSLSHCMSGRTKDIASGVVFAAIDAILILG